MTICRHPNMTVERDACRNGTEMGQSAAVRQKGCHLLPPLLLGEDLQLGPHLTTILDNCIRRPWFHFHQQAYLTLPFSSLYSSIRIFFLFHPCLSLLFCSSIFFRYLCSRINSYVIVCAFSLWCIKC